MINKIQLLFSLKEPQNKKILTDLLFKEWQLIKQKFPILKYRQAIRLPDDPTASVPQDGQPDDLPEQPNFDVIFELRGEEVPFNSLIDAVKDLGFKVEPLIDKFNSAALVGKEHIIVDGTESLFLNMVLRRPKKWSRDDWHFHWLEHHAAEVKENVKGLEGYRQFHADEDASRKASKVIKVDIYDYEGTAEGYYSSLEKFLETLSDPEVSKDTGFIDHGRSVMWLCNLYE